MCWRAVKQKSNQTKAGEAIWSQFAMQLKFQINLNLAYLQIFQRRKSRFILCLNVFEHKIEVIMPW